MRLTVDILVRDFKVDLDKFDDVPELPEFKGDLKKVGLGAVVDFETTDIDEVTYGEKEAVEIGAVKFAFDKSSYEFLGVVDTLSQLNEPSDSKKMTETIKEVTGLTFDDVKGHAFDVDEIVSFFEDCDMVYAHNSRFDKPLLDKLIKKTPFACSMSDIDWSSKGYVSKSQEVLALQTGFKYSAHRASMDCNANLALLVKSETFSQFMEDAFKKKGYLKVQGFTDPYSPDKKAPIREAMKAHDNEFGAKFSFNGKEKIWHTSILAEDKAEEVKNALISKMRSLYHEKTTQTDSKGRPQFAYPTVEFVESSTLPEKD